MSTFFWRLAISAPVWFLLATIGFGQMYMSARTRGGEPFGFPIEILAANYLYWWLATPAIMHLTYRFPVHGGQWKTSIGVHAAAGLVSALIPELIRVVVMYIIVRPAGTRGPFWLYRAQLGNRYVFEVTTYVAIAAVIATFDLIQRSRDRELHATRLEAELAQARVQALSSQLHPHFLFNALNSVAMLIRDGEREAALRTVVAYGDLLRDVMNPASVEIPLGDEIAFINRYLEIEQTRFPDMLTTSIDVPRELEGALVPSFLLQPIVENALHHAFSGLEAGTLSVSATRHNGTLHLEVTDNGRGLPVDWSLTQSTGVGLRNTRLRLAEHYGESQRLELKSMPGAGTRVTLEIPLRLSFEETPGD